MRRTSILAAAILVASTLTGVSVAPAHAAPDAGTVLPPGPAGATVSRLSFAGDDVWADWTTDGVSTLYKTADDGTGAWQVVDDPETGQPVTGAVVRSWDGLSMTFQPDPADTRCSIVRVASAAGVWQTPGGSCLNSPTVGAGAELVRFFDNSTPHHSFLYRAADGSPVDGYNPSATSPATSGNWAWSVQGGELVGHDTSGTSPDRDVPLPSDCQFVGPQSVTGLPAGDQWGLAECATGDVVVPLDTQQVPLKLLVSDPVNAIGNGFTYGRVLQAGQSKIVVRDMSAQLVSHDYGPGGPVVGSDEGAPRVAWIESGTTVHVAHLDWLGPPATKADDTTPPTIDSTGSLPLVAYDGSTLYLSFGWTASDNLPGPLAFDVEEAHPRTSDPTFNPFQHTYNRSADFQIRGGPGEICFRVRATDRVGNVSDWSSPRCTLIDTDPPEMTDEVADTSGLPVLPSSTTRVRVTDRFHAQDDTGVTSYDVQLRIAHPGAGFGEWTSPASWQGVTATSVTRRLAPGAEACFRSRAHDGVGRTSGWGDRHCFVAPYDDTAFRAHGSASRRTVAGALGGGLTRIENSSDGSLTRGGLVGRTILVRERIYQNTIACPEITWAGRRLWQCTGGPEGPRFAWTGTASRRTRQGTVRIVGDWVLPTGIDAIAVVR